MGGSFRFGGWGGVGGGVGWGGGVGVGWSKACQPSKTKRKMAGYLLRRQPGFTGKGRTNISKVPFLLRHTHMPALQNVLWGNALFGLAARNKGDPTGAASKTNVFKGSMSICKRVCLTCCSLVQSRPVELLVSLVGPICSQGAKGDRLFFPGPFGK